jgi:hypothetical protein
MARLHRRVSTHTREFWNRFLATNVAIDRWPSMNAPQKRQSFGGEGAIAVESRCPGRVYVDGEVGCVGSLALGHDVHLASWRSVGYRDGTELCQDLAVQAGVVAIPSAAFYADPEAGRELIRFAFCKTPAVISTAASRLAAFAADRQEGVSRWRPARRSA